MSASTVRPAVVLLDLDGCLVDSRAAITHCLERAFRKSGVSPRPVEELVPLIGPPLSDGLTQLLEAAGTEPDLAARCAEAYRRCYEQEALDRTVVVDGVPPALERMARTASLAVVTSKPLDIAHTILEASGIAARLTAVHAPDRDHGGEPKAITLGRALADVAPGQLPAATMMVGDRAHDVRAGRACGTVTVGVTWGIGDRAELTDAGADHVVDRPSELAELVAG